jgi:hypothetical protein
MRLRATSVLFAGSLAAGCGSDRLVPPAGTTLAYSVTGQSESSLCQSPVIRESTCTITLTARVELGDLDGRGLSLRLVQSAVRDGRTGLDLGATPRELTADDIRRLTGSSVVAAHERLTIPLTLQFTVGQAPFYVDGPHELHVSVLAERP